MKKRKSNQTQSLLSPYSPLLNVEIKIDADGEEQGYEIKCRHLDAKQLSDYNKYLDELSGETKDTRKTRKKLNKLYDRRNRIGRRLEIMDTTSAVLTAEMDDMDDASRAEFLRIQPLRMESQDKYDALTDEIDDLLDTLPEQSDEEVIAYQEKGAQKLFDLIVVDPGELPVAMGQLNIRYQDMVPYLQQRLAEERGNA